MYDVFAFIGIIIVSWLILRGIVATIDDILK